MSRSQKLRLFVTQRLNAAVEEILAAFEETIVKYEEEAALSQQVISRQHALLCALDKTVMEAPAAGEPPPVSPQGILGHETFCDADRLPPAGGAQVIQ